MAQLKINSIQTGRQYARTQRHSDAPEALGLALVGLGLLVAIAGAGNPGNGLTASTILLGLAGTCLMVAGLTLVLHGQARAQREQARAHRVSQRLLHQKRIS